MFQNEYDTRNSLLIGRRAEKKFKDLAIRRGYSVSLPLHRQDYEEHWDIRIRKGAKSYLVDVKAMKRLKGEIQDLWVWVEIVNIAGKPGWIYRTHAHLIAFETMKGFVLVKPEELRNLVAERVEKKMVKYPEHAHYCLYQRDGRDDLITLISMADIKSASEEIWEE